MTNWRKAGAAFVVVLLLPSAVGLYFTGPFGPCEEELSRVTAKSEVTARDSGTLVVTTSLEVPKDRDGIVLIKISQNDSEYFYMTRWSWATGAEGGSKSPNLTKPATIERSNIPFEITPGDTLSLMYVGDSLRVPPICGKQVDMTVWRSELHT